MDNESNVKEQPSYILVNFSLDGETGEFDIISRDWIKIDNEKKTLSCPFIGDNATKEEKEKCDNLIKNSKPPLKDWKPYEIVIRGSADGLKRLEQLRTEKYVFSTGDEDPEKGLSLKLKQEIITKKIINM
ncbi:hypothetical protein HCN44_007830 [Aphidius gifuensis]|uniref:Uncharacterized protein n=1 Tax=Aphidius gifuensis TaxID=684658 RepID=A0A834XL69_APHGI|nr:hypothetical protein HCN44_007830 [Aphidius gifuensis]